MELPEKALFTVSELAELCGITKTSAIQATRRLKIKPLKVSPVLNLYTAAQVREVLWRRKGRRLSKQKAPFLIPALVKWFQDQDAAEQAVTPTDAQLRADEILQRKLARIVRTATHADFAAKVDLAKKVQQLLQILE